MNYFAYGSNMDEQRMKVEREITFSKRCAAHLPGYRLEFNKVADDNHQMGYANIVPDDSGLVEGALYDIEADSLLILDKKKCEGYPEHYLHIPIKVRLPDNGQEIRAIAYIAKPDKIRGGLKPTKKYMNHLLAGKDILSDSYFNRLQNIETLN